MSQKHMKYFESFVNLSSIEMNWKNSRDRIADTSPPLIPMLEVYQSDLVFLDSCGSNTLPDGSINFLKFQRTVKCISQIGVRTYDLISRFINQYLTI